MSIRKALYIAGWSMAGFGIGYAFADMTINDHFLELYNNCREQFGTSEDCRAKFAEIVDGPSYLPYVYGFIGSQAAALFAWIDPNLGTLSEPVETSLLDKPREVAPQISPEAQLAPQSPPRDQPASQATSYFSSFSTLFSDSTREMLRKMPAAFEAVTKLGKYTP